jgi:hypothetical protein
MILPANIGKLYFIHGYEQYKNIFLDLITEIYPAAFNQLKTNAHERVEIIAKNINSGGAILHFINITGFSGNTYFGPLPVLGINFKLQTGWKPSRAFLLSSKKPLAVSYDNGVVSATLPSLAEFESVILVK